MGVKQTQDDASRTITLEGTVGIADAAELKTVLTGALAAGGSVSVEFGNPLDLDITAVQLLWAARKKAESAGVSLSFSGELSESMRETLAHAGFANFPAQ